MSQRISEPQYDIAVFGTSFFPMVQFIYAPLLLCIRVRVENFGLRFGGCPKVAAHMHHITIMRRLLTTAHIAILHLKLTHQPKYPVVHHRHIQKLMEFVWRTRRTWWGDSDHGCFAVYFFLSVIHYTNV
jgi:hypothetical protein